MIATGIAFLLCGFAWISFLTETGTYVRSIMLPLLFLGLGQGFSMSPLTNLGICDTSAENSGSASGLVNAAHQIGGSVGLSIMVAWNDAAASMMIRFQRAMLIGLLFVVLMLLTVLTFIRNEKQAKSKI